MSQLLEPNKHAYSEDKLSGKISSMRSHAYTAEKTGRTKLSTTVSPETYAFLEQMVKRGQAASLAEALDRAIRKIRRLENRKRLAHATSRYFEQLDSETIAEENALAKDMMSGAGTIDFDKEI